MLTGCKKKALNVVGLFMVFAILSGCSVKDFIDAGEQKLGEATQEVTQDAITITVQTMTGDSPIGQDGTVATVATADAPCGSIFGYKFSEKVERSDEFMSLLIDSKFCNGTPPRMLEDEYRLDDKRRRYYIAFKEDSADQRLYTNSTYSAIYGYYVSVEDRKEFEDCEFCLGNLKLWECSLSDIKNYYGEPYKYEPLFLTDAWVISQYSWCTEHSAEPNLFVTVKEWNNGGVSIESVEYLVPTEWVDKTETSMDSVEEEPEVTGYSDGRFE